MLRKIRSSLNSNPSFIEVYDNEISLDDCQRLISLFEKYPNKGRGKVVYNGRNEQIDEIKKCIEIPDRYFSKGDVISNIIASYLKKIINEYMQKYSELNSDYVGRWHVDDIYTFKKYETKDDGFKIWHTEQTMGSASSRVLVWMFYLNDAKSGTEFKYFPTVDAKMGRGIIWPATFTHMHRSESNKGLKYIVSGWMSFF